MRPLLPTLMLALTLAPAHGRADPAKVDCAKAMLRFAQPGSYACYDLGQASGTGNFALTQSAALVGNTAENVKLSLFATRISSGDAWFRPWVVGTSAEPKIRDFNNVTRAATGWGKMHEFDGSTYVISFESGQRHCTGFVHGENSTLGGYEFVAYGYFCAAEEKPALTDSDTKALLGGMTLTR